jgi:hypothetical protein
MSSYTRAQLAVICYAGTADVAIDDQAVLGVGIAALKTL